MKTGKSSRSIVMHSTLFFTFFMILFSVLFTGHLRAEGRQQSWWMTSQRMLQTNLREIDATMNLETYIADIDELGANVVLFNVGGIVANYPTDLEFHWRNTHMKGDLLGTVLERLHAKGFG